MQFLHKYKGTWKMPKGDHGLPLSLQLASHQHGLIFNTEGHKKHKVQISHQKRPGEYPGFNYDCIRFLNADES